MDQSQSEPEAEEPCTKKRRVERRDCRNGMAELAKDRETALGYYARNLGMLLVRRNGDPEQMFFWDEQQNKLLRPGEPPCLSGHERISQGDRCKTCNYHKQCSLHGCVGGRHFSAVADGPTYSEDKKEKGDKEEKHKNNKDDRVKGGEGTDSSEVSDGPASSAVAGGKHVVNPHHLLSSRASGVKPRERARLIYYPRPSAHPMAEDQSPHRQSPSEHFADEQSSEQPDTELDTESTPVDTEHDTEPDKGLATEPTKHKRRSRMSRRRYDEKQRNIRAKAENETFSMEWT